MTSLIGLMVAAAAPGEATEAGILASEFRQVCMHTAFDPETAEHAMHAVGWKVVRQRNGADDAPVRWTVTRGDGNIASVRIDRNFGTWSCTLEQSRPVGLKELAQALNLPEPRYTERPHLVVSQVIDRRDAQSWIQLTDLLLTETPDRGIGTKPGLMIVYSHGEGRGAWRPRRD